MRPRVSTNSCGSQPPEAATLSGEHALPMLLTRQVLVTPSAGSRCRERLARHHPLPKLRSPTAPRSTSRLSCREMLEFTRQVLRAQRREWSRWARSRGTSCDGPLSLTRSKANIRPGGGFSVQEENSCVACSP